MTQITKEAIESLAAALEPFAAVAEHDIGTDETATDFFAPMKEYNRAPRLLVGDLRLAKAALDTFKQEIAPALSTLPIAGEGKVKALDEAEGPFHVSQTSDGKDHWYSARDAASGVSIPGKSKENAEALVYSLNRAFDLHLRLASASSPGEAVAWNERENAFTDFWEQCPKLVDASDVGKARQAFMAGMDAASFFDSIAIKTTTGLVERLRKRADEDQACADNSKVIVDALSEQMRLFESREGHNVYAVRMAVDHKSSLGRDSRYAADLREAAEILSRPQPASTALVERPQVLKGVGKINGDGWKDTTKVGEVVFAWNEELPPPYKPGQFPRIGCEHYTASTDQYDFTPASISDIRAYLNAAKEGFQS